MRQKYFENKWLDHALLQSHKDKVRTMLAKQFTEDGLPIVTKSRSKMVSGFSRIPLIADNEMNFMKDDNEEEIHVESPVNASTPSAPIDTSPKFNSSSDLNILPPPPTTPNGRASMESNHSSLSAKSFVSAQSQPQEDYVSSKRRSMKSNRSSTESTRYSISSVETSCGATVLTAEQIAERCRNTIASKDFLVVEEDLPIQEVSSLNISLDHPVEELPDPVKPVAEQKTMPSLKINVAQANKAFVHSQRHEENRQLKVVTTYKKKCISRCN